MNVQKAKKLDESRSRIPDAEELVQIALTNTVRNQNQSETKEILETLADYLTVADHITKEAVQHSGGSMSYVHDRQEAHLRRTNKPGNITQRTPLRQVQNFIQSNENILTEEKRHKYEISHANEMKVKHGVGKCKENSQVIIVASTNHLNTRSHQRQSVQVQKPANGHQYTSLEAAEILSNVQNAKAVINKWIEQKLVPCKKTRLYEILKAHKEGNPIRDWGHTGRSAIASMEDVKKMVATATAGGNTMGTAEMMVELKKRCPEGEPPSKKTCMNYLTLAASCENSRCTTHATIKSNTRFTAENSIMSAVSFAVTAAGTCFIPEVTADPSNKEFSSICPNDRRLSSMVARALGTPVTPVKPSLLFSTDDTTVFACRGLANGAHEWRIASADQPTSTHAAYRVGSDSMFEGIRVRLTVTISAAGMMAPIYATVTGLKDTEMPIDLCPSGIVIIEVPGLCCGNVDIRNQQSGYIVFLRQSGHEGNGSTETENFRLYREKVLLPFINDCRVASKYTPGDEVADEFTAVSWIDGAMAQFQVVVDESSQVSDAVRKVVSCKHAAAATGTQQPADLCATFRLLKHLAKVTTISTGPSTALGGTIKQAIAASVVTLSTKKCAALVDFTACLPEMLTKAASPQLIIDGFEASGLYSRNDEGPDFLAMLKTCRRHLTDDELSRCYQHFNTLLSWFMENGIVSDDNMRSLGFADDIDAYGKVVIRPDSMTQENWQRAKCLSSTKQRQMRLDMIRSAQEKIHQKQMEGQLKKLAMLNENSKCEDIIYRLLRQGEGDHRSKGDVIATADYATFAKCSVSQLKSFIHVRLFSGISTRGSGFTWPNKGSEAMSQSGEMCLVKIAFDNRMTPIVFQANQNPSASGSSTRDVATPPLFIVLPQTGSPVYYYGETRLPSEFMNNECWKQHVLMALQGGNGKNICEDGAKADHLYKLLRLRLNEHKSYRISDENKRSHWSLNWAAANLSRLAAMCVLFGIVEDDLGAVTMACPILDSDISKFQKVDSELSKLQGCYLYYDTKKRHQFVRSGKAVGLHSNFGVRHEAHVKGSKSATTSPSSASSEFYTSYPDRSCMMDTSVSGVRRGYFDDLAICVGIGFDHSNTEAVGLLCHTTDGIFLWPPDVIDSIGRGSFNNSSSLEEKQLHMVGYLLELALDLMISPKNCVSQSPGFESCLHIYGNVE